MMKFGSTILAHLRVLLGHFRYVRTWDGHRWVKPTLLRRITFTLGMARYHYKHFYKKKSA
jgi:hypothetical protein